MDKGLAKFLNRIAADPKNKVLVGRYLALVADLPELRVKQEHLFALSATLAGPDPLTALVHLEELAKAAPQALEVLDLQFKCYQQLGKTSEAAALKSKIDT